MSGLSSIVQVDIAISAPVVDSTSFDYILIVGPKPKNVPTIPSFYEKVDSSVSGALKVVTTSPAGVDEVELSVVKAVSPDLNVSDGDYVLYHAQAQKEPKKVSVYSDLKEVTDCGWVAVGNNTDPVGVAARIAFSQSPKPSKIFIAVQQKSADSSGTEEVAETLNRALGTNGWYVICPAGISEDKYEEIAEWTEANNKMFAFTSPSINPNFNVKEYFRTFWIFGRENTSQLSEDVPEANKYMHIAWACTSLNYDSGSETWAFKSLVGVNPSTLTSGEMNTIEENGGNHYTTVAGKNITRPGKVYSGEWIDTIRFRDWLQNDMQVRIFNLFVTNPKIPYTDQGIALVQNQMIASLKSGQVVGGIADTEYDEDNNEVPGFTVKVPRSASLTASQRASRKLEGCKFTARLAGAIHMVEIKGTLVS